MSPTPELNPPEGNDAEETTTFTVNKEFLEFTFGKEVESYEVKLGSNPGDNYMSIIHAVAVVFKGNSDVHHYVIKCYPNHPSRREMLDQLNLFEKELFIYNEFYPTLQKVIDDSGASDAITGLSAPPFYGGNATTSVSEKYKGSPWEKENFIIMGDLRKQDYKMEDRMKGMGVDCAILVLKTIGKMHAITWALRQKKGGKLLSSSYPRLLDDMYSNEKLMDDWSGLFDHIAQNAFNILEGSIGADHPAYQNFKKVAEVKAMEEIMKKFTSPQGISEEYFEEKLRIKPKEDPNYEKEPWLIATHGDLWMNNMLFKSETNEGVSKPVDVIFVDFQICREACPTLDISYFLSSSIRASERIANKDKFLRTYYDSFLRTCEELNVKPFPGFSFENLKRRYRRTEMFGILIALPLLTFVLKPPEESIDLDKAGNDKDISDVFGSVIAGSDKNKTLRDELTASVLDMYETGVL